MSEAKPLAGWGWPANSKKAHYFVEGVSLCRKWMFAGTLEQGKDDSLDNCAACKKAVAKTKPKPVTSKCFRCDGTGSVCNRCGESGAACECVNETDEGDMPAEEFDDCEDCGGTGYTTSALTN